MDIIAIERGGKNFAMTDLCILSSMKTSKTETTWRCVRRVADYCHVILKTTNDALSTLAKPHNHPSDKTAVEIEKCRKIMKQQANSTNDRPNQILTFSTARALDEVKARQESVTVVPVSSTSLEHAWLDYGRSTSNQQVSLTCGSQSPNHLETNWKPYRLTASPVS